MPSQISQRTDLIVDILKNLSLHVQTNQVLRSGPSSYQVDIYLPDFHTAIEVSNLTRKMGSAYRCKRLSDIGLFSIGFAEEAWSEKGGRNGRKGEAAARDRIAESLMDLLRNASSTADERRERFGG